MNIRDGIFPPKSVRRKSHHQQTFGDLFRPVQPRHLHHRGHGGRPFNDRPPLGPEGAVVPGGAQGAPGGSNGGIPNVVNNIPNPVVPAPTIPDLTPPTVFSPTHLPPVNVPTAVVVTAQLVLPKESTTLPPRVAVIPPDNTPVGDLLGTVSALAATETAALGALVPEVTSIAQEGLETVTSELGSVESLAASAIADILGGNLSPGAIAPALGKLNITTLSIPYPKPPNITAPEDASTATLPQTPHTEIGSEIPSNLPANLTSTEPANVTSAILPNPSSAIQGNLTSNTSGNLTTSKSTPLTVQQPLNITSNPTLQNSTSESPALVNGSFANATIPTGSSGYNTTTFNSSSISTTGATPQNFTLPTTTSGQSTTTSPLVVTTTSSGFLTSFTPSPTSPFGGPGSAPTAFPPSTTNTGTPASSGKSAALAPALAGSLGGLALLATLCLLFLLVRRRRRTHPDALLAPGWESQPMSEGGFVVISGQRLNTGPRPATPIFPRVDTPERLSQGAQRASRFREDL